MKKLFLIFLLALCGCEVQMRGDEWIKAESACANFGGVMSATYRNYSWGRNLLSVICNEQTVRVDIPLNKP